MPYAKHHKIEKEKERHKRRMLEGYFSKYRPPKRDKSLWNRGAYHPNWKGGISKDRLKGTNSKEYRLWRKVVVERDNWTCQTCGSVGGNLHAHHISSWKEFKELRYEPNNGITLCTECHLNIHFERRKKHEHI